MTTPVAPNNKNWLKKLISGEPHLIIPHDIYGVYLKRWYVIPRNRKLNIYIHQFLWDDDDRALHDHPWWFVTLILKGGYIEETRSRDGKIKLMVRTSVFNIKSPFWKRCVAYRPARWRHRVILPHLNDGLGRVPCWTLIITGPNNRKWGFWCEPRKLRNRSNESKFIPWDEFESQGGCGEL